MPARIRAMTATEHFRALTSLPSPSWGEEPVRKYIKEVMASDGYLLREDSYGNLLFHRGRKGPSNLLSAHMDTVPKAVNARLVETEERFMTDGTTALGADDKCALAAMLELADEKRDALFLFLVAEEIGCDGSSRLTPGFFEGLDINACFIPDASGDTGLVITAAPGKNLFSVTVHGREAHAGFCPEEGISAIEVLSEAVTKLPLGRIDGGTTSNIGSFLAEGATNVVCGKAEAVFEIRSVDEGRLEEVTGEMLRIIKETAEGRGASCDISLRHAYSAYRVPEDSRALEELRRALEGEGITPRLGPTTGGSDTNNLRPLGIDSITFSAGYHNPHTEKEYITKAELGKLVRILRALSQPLPRLPS